MSDTPCSSTCENKLATAASSESSQRSRMKYGHYDCLLCSATQMSPHNLIQHFQGRKHNHNINLVDPSSKGPDTFNVQDLHKFDADSVEPYPNRIKEYANPSSKGPAVQDLHKIDAASVKPHPKRINGSENCPSGSRTIESTACVPPRKENDRIERRISKLQTTIDEISDIPIVGLEHILDVQMNGEASYLCVLCQKKFDRISDVVEHLTSNSHRLQYLKFFPKLFDEVSYLIEMVCEGVENKYHRSKLTVLDKSEFSENKEKFIRLSSTEYINETIGCSELIADEDIAATDVHATVINDEIISISSHTSSEDTVPTSTSVKVATLWSQMTATRNELMKTYQLYVTNPNSYPDYAQMWVSFWNTRIVELRESNTLNTYDWTSEWSSEWRRIMNEKLKADLAVKCSRIKKTLGITDDMLGEREKDFMQFPQILLDNMKPVMSPSTPRAVLAEKPISFNASEPRMRSRSPQQPNSTHSVPNRNSGQISSASDEQKKTTTLSNNCQTLSGLELLLEKHNHNDDFMISWRELLDIFGIEDNQNSNSTKSVPPQTYTEHNDPSKKQMEFVDNAVVEEHPVKNDEPVTVISVLRTLVALEEMLGSFAPKVVDLLQTAIAMERLKTDSSSTLLNNSNNNCILFETVKEKFKGLLLGDLVAENVQKNVRKAINDMTILLQSAERSKACYVLPTFNRNVEKTSPQGQTFLSIDSLKNCGVLPTLFQCAAKASPQPQISQLIESPRNCYEPPPSKRIEKTTPQPQTPVSIENQKSCSVMPSFDRTVETTSPQSEISSSPPSADDTDEPVVLKDSEIKVLMTKFSYLSDKDKVNFTGFLKKLRISDPDRVKRLKNEICQNHRAGSSVLEWETEMNRPGEATHVNSMNYAEDKFDREECDRIMSMAYQVAHKNAAVKIKRKKHDESDGIVEGKRFYQG